MKWRWTCGLVEELMYRDTQRRGDEKKSGGSGVTVQLWLRPQPKWKPGCGLVLHQQLGSHLLQFVGTTYAVFQQMFVCTFVSVFD